MRLSTKVRYGVRAMTELARRDDGRFTPLRHLAESQGLSAKYLEQMASQLRIAGLIHSIRGVDGGYRLAKAANRISIWDIYCVLDVSSELLDCRNSNCSDRSGKCSRYKRCAAKNIWLELSESVQAVMKSWTLQRLADDQTAMDRPAKKKR